MGNRYPRRKPLRLHDFNYNTPGAYFITICTYKRRCTLSHIVGAIHESPVVELTEYGRMVEDIINTIPERFHVNIHRYVIMPNHIHLIVVLPNNLELQSIFEVSAQSRSIISKLIGYIKMNSSKRIHAVFGHSDIWQRGYHDHIIRDRSDYERITAYICQNPTIWQWDCFYTNEQ